MLHTHSVPLFLDLIGAGVLLLATVPCATKLAASVLVPKRLNHDDSDRKGDFYVDKDGTASEESLKEFSVRKQNVLLGFITAAGTALSLAAAVLSLTDRKADFWPGQGRNVSSWIQFGVWVLLSIQTASILRERQSIKRYNAGIVEALAFLLQLALICATNWPLLQGRVPPYAKTVFGLTVAELAMAAIGVVTCTSYPRRPDVYHKDQIVDRQFAVSVLYRYTYAWPVELLAAARKRQLVLKDYPMLDHNCRAKDAYARAERLGKRQKSLSRLLLRSHRRAFGWQFVFTTLNSLLLIAPQLAMYQLLKLLEARDLGATIGFQGSFWVVGMGLAMLFLSLFENGMWWISYGHLSLPIRVQLGAMVFNKAMRRKDAKDTGRTKKAEGDAIVETGPVAEAGQEAEAPGAEPEDNLQKTRQGTINLVGVDAKRVADFVCYNHLIYASVIKLGVSFTFLAKLIGWQGLLAGVAVQLCFLPINIYFANRYTNAQDDLMKMRDRKLAVLSEALNGIRQIKFSALERQWQERIRDVRNRELSVQWRVFSSDTMLIFCWIIGPVMLSAVSIGVYAVMHGSLSPSVAFTTISVLLQIEGTLAYIPELVTLGIDALISLRRIEEYLESPEKPQNTTPGDVIALRDATISWPVDDLEDNEDAFKLHNISVEFPIGELSVISGRTGSGKSLMLNALLGEVEVLDGSIVVPTPPSAEERYDHKANKDNWILPSAIAYVSQIPWIENATLKDNILFGLPHDEPRYQSVVSACALDKDLEILEDGDLTEIGANGINLSGGQRWRVTLARALYSRAGILVLDDIFSAVDAHVGRHIFDEALTGELSQGRTRILVTHHVSLCLPKTKYEVRLGDGKIEHAGLVEQLQKSGALQEIIQSEDQQVAMTEEDAAGELPELSRVRSRRRSSHAERRGSGLSTRSVGLQQVRSRSIPRESESSSSSTVIVAENAPNGKAQPKKFVKEEHRQTGRVQWSVYLAYMKACGGWPHWTAVLAMFLFYQVLILGRSWWLKLWTERRDVEAFMLHVQSPRMHSTEPSFDAPRRDPNLQRYLVIYIIISVSMCFQGTLRYLIVFWGSIRASRKLFEDLTYAVLRAPLRWLDTMPVGRVLNRFTADFNMVDSSMANNFAYMLFNILMLLSIIVAGILVSPFILALAVVLFAMCLNYAFYYLSGAREAKRLESTSKSPIFELFSTALLGVSSLRAFYKTDAYITRMYERIDGHARALFHMLLFNRWLSWRLGVIGSVFATVTAAIIISIKHIDAALGGFALGFMLDYTHTVVMMLRQYSNLELGMNAVERIKEYSEIEIEDHGGLDAPAAWPVEGRLEVDNLVVSYAPDLPAVLRGVSFSVERNERIGVVGRTGAGKSSLTLALFRFLKASSGTVHIDGLDISKIKLYDLRSRLAIIPQDPVLFSGTVRSNIDPFNQHEDHELRDALERVHLVTASSNESGTNTPAGRPGSSGTDANVNIFTSLSSTIGEGGLNLSQGQRQLLCLARAIVARPKIMVLDEATSAVDKTTDELIQRSIRAEFSDSTLIVIAHRLSTIADFDRILVLSEGLVAEYDSPRNLLDKEGGVFREMVEDSGEREVLREIILGTSED